MNDHFKSVVRKLDTAGLEEREERRAIRKDEQKEQQIDGAEAARRGMRSFLSESDRKVYIERLKGDPAMAFFLLANSRHDLT